MVLDHFTLHSHGVWNLYIPLFINRENISKGVKETLHKDYKVGQLKKAVEFSTNIHNKQNLADKLAQQKNYPVTIKYYTSCLQGFINNDI